MGILRFESWCRNAVSDIRDRTDRERVYGELYAHMEDQYDELIAGGMAEAEAEKAVVAAMGDAADTARQLRKLYPPIWHHLLLAARLVLLFAFLQAVFTVPWYLESLNIQPSHLDFYFEEPTLSEERLADDVISERRIFYNEPMSRDESDGYRFTLTRAAERCATWENEDGGVRDTFSLFLSVEVYHPSLRGETSGALREFYAVDSLGNRYKAANRSDNGTEGPHLRMSCHRSDFFTYTWEVQLDSCWSQEAEWIELRYDKAGRSVRLRADLKGGGVE